MLPLPHQNNSSTSTTRPLMTTGRISLLYTYVRHPSCVFSFPSQVRPAEQMTQEEAEAEQQTVQQSSRETAKQKMRKRSSTPKEQTHSCTKRHFARSRKLYMRGERDHEANAQAPNSATAPCSPSRATPYKAQQGLRRS